MRDLARHDQPVVADQRFPGRAHSLFARGSQRDVGRAGVPPVEGPGCFAVADYEGAGGGHFGYAHRGGEAGMWVGGGKGNGWL